MLISLAVATLLRSQVMARVFRDEDMSDASSSSMVVEEGGQESLCSGYHSGRLLRQLCVIRQECVHHVEFVVQGFLFKVTKPGI